MTTRRRYSVSYIYN